MLDVAAVRALLAGTRFADVHVVAETGSTNDDVLPLLAREDPTPHTLVAEYQTRGVGRRGRSWQSTKATGLLWTTTLPPIPVKSLWAVPFWVGLRIAEGIADATELRIQLQWPNDIMLDGRKIAGVLCISRVAGEQAIVGCGVGMNVFRPDEKLAIDQPAAFIADYAATTREQILACILHRFDESLSELRTPQTVARTWEQRARLAGTPYRIQRDGESQPFVAYAKRIGQDGALVVEREGLEEEIALGDARIVR